jgi:hypothetical protein
MPISLRLRAILVSGALLGILVRPTRAEDLLEYKYADYAEADGRMAIITQSALVQQDLGTDTELKFTGTNDAITGASPIGLPIALFPTAWLQKSEDHRKAWSADVIRQEDRVNVDLGFAYSREHDYTSYGWSVNTTTDFNQKNTTLLLGAAGTEDYVRYLYFGPPWRRKHGGDGVIGVTQLLDPNTSVTFDVTWGRETGFLTDQYKVVEASVQVFQSIYLDKEFVENRPNLRDHATAFLELNRAFTAAHGAVDASYRYYQDTYGVKANTLELSWLQHLGEAVVLIPSARLYQQSAAFFYHYRLDGTGIVPVPFPDGTGEFYSSDYRLSAELNRTLGLKAVWTIRPGISVDLAYDDYQMRGTDGVTPQAYYPHARITTAGFRYSW